MTREELTSAVAKAFSKNHNIAIQAATGVGKSKLALELCNEISKRENNEPKILLVIAEVAHYRNWEEEIKKWSFRTPVFIVCYASLKKYRNTEWDVVIFDEAHHLKSALRLDAFDSIKAKYRIFLSATLKDSLLFRLEESCGPISNIKMGLQDAFVDSVLPEPKIYLLPLTLDNKVYNQSIVEEWGTASKRVPITCLYSERWRYLKNKKKLPNVTLTIKCTQQQKYDYLTEQFLFYKKRYIACRNEAIKNKWLQCGAKRKIFLGLQKTSFAETLLRHLQNKRFICFCTNIEQAEFLGGDNAVHSNKKNRMEIIQNFNDKKINNIFAVGMLQEGVNLTDIEAGIIVQLDGEERAFIQKFGRALRADSPEQYIIYFKATRDEEYLNNALESIDKNYIKQYENCNR